MWGLMLILLFVRFFVLNVVVGGRLNIINGVDFIWEFFFLVYNDELIVYYLD